MQRSDAKQQISLDGDAYVSSETPLGDNSVWVQSPKRVFRIWTHTQLFRVAGRPDARGIAI